jgi:hypothetical protein
MSEKPFERAMRLVDAVGLPGVAIGTHYSRPSLGVAGKQFAGWRDGALSLRIPMEQKEFLLEFAPEIYFETDHYKGWPWLLIRLDVISDDELSQRLTEAWKFRAPKKLVVTFTG